MERIALQIGTVPISLFKWGLSLFALVAAPCWAFDANGVALGAAEADVQKAFPAARCKPMEWNTDAADRRCDDGPVSFGGAQARISFFLKKDAVQAFDVRFDARDLARVAAFLKSSYGAPDAEGEERIQRRRETRVLHKLRWKRGEDRAVLTSESGRRRVDLNVWRGDFDTEVYDIK